MGLDNWIVTFTKPNGEKVVWNSTRPESRWVEARRLMTMTTGVKHKSQANDVGTWWIQVDLLYDDWGPGGYN